MIFATKVLDKSRDQSRLCLIAGIGVFVLSIMPPLLMDTNTPAFLSTPELIRYHGYYPETHLVFTDDGFIIEQHRLNSASMPHKSYGPPVIIQHGFMCTSESWVLMGRQKDLAFILADAGFDVWLTNHRGTPYGRVHDAFKDIKKFNDFSFDEFGLEDMSATIDYVLETTGYQNLTYIGHSMGTLMLGVLLSSKPEYNSKVNHFVALSPVWKRPSFSEPSHVLVEWVWSVMGPFFEIVDFMGVFQLTPLRQYAASYLYGDNLLGQMINPVCNFVILHFAGVESRRSLTVPCEVLGAKFPTGYIHYTLKHYHQLIDEDEFRRRDFGPEENMKRYNLTKPPVYDTSRILVPTSIYHSDADTISCPKTVEWAASHIRNIVKVRNVPGFNHFDIMWSEAASQYVYKDILGTLLQAQMGTSSCNASDCTSA